MEYAIPVIFAIIFAASAQIDLDWCAVQKEFCNGREHIACLPNSFTSSDLVSDVQVLELTEDQKSAILTAHNEYRNSVASGAFSNISFPAATKMGEMQWDDTLQYLAEVHASYGEMKHDQCRATPENPWSGQNLFQWMSSADNIKVDTILSRACAAWFDEIHVADPALVDNFLIEHLSAAGHFSVMVNDLNNRVGCGASKYNYNYNGRRWFSILLTCNYEYTNMLNTPTYTRARPPALDCQRSHNFPNLCNNS